MEIEEEDLELIVEQFKKFPEISEGILFGSRAMGNAKKGSDVDLALKGEGVDEVLITLLGILENEIPLPYHFDLINYHQIKNQELKDHIDCHGKVIWKRDI
jgi:predicted nucleotidyltransferase